MFSPGRFLLAHQLKFMFAYMVSAYDIRIGDGWTSRPPNFVFGEGIVPNLSAHVSYRRRQPTHDTHWLLGSSPCHCLLKPKSSYALKSLRMKGYVAGSRTRSIGNTRNIGVSNTIIVKDHERVIELQSTERQTGLSFASQSVISTSLQSPPL